jgi:uncharacterized membrane protein
MRMDRDRGSSSPFLRAGILLAAAGGVLFAVNKLRPRPDGEETEPLEVRASLTILRTPDDVYEHWRRLEHLPEDLRHGASNAEFSEEHPPERLQWRSSVRSKVPSRGELRLRPWREGEGTRFDLLLRIEHPGGSSVRSSLDREIGEGLRRFKSQMEAGEVAEHA